MARVLLLILLSFQIEILSAQSQAEMNLEAKNDYQRSENWINSVYQKILKKYNNDPVFIKNIRTAQRLWIQFRDADMKAMFPEKEGYYGSVYSMCWYNYMSELTRERTKKLITWLEGTPEGNVCAGSIRNN